tara:strand:+ start:501 stop:671 length:171 start_codon:yes stop_codon:yes gene_type:complete
MKPQVSIDAHAIFANDVYKLLIQAGVSKVVICNSISHESNLIDLSTILSNAVQQQI